VALAVTTVAALLVCLVGVRSLPEHLSTFLEEAAWSRRLGDEGAAAAATAMRRSRELDRITQEVLAGRSTLLQGATELRTVITAGWDEKEWERFRLVSKSLFSGNSSDDERFCRILIRRADNEVRANPGTPTSVSVAELEAQLAQFRRTNDFGPPESTEGKR
jgi:hypothetical protein